LGDWSSSEIYDSNKVLNKTLTSFHSKAIIFLKYLPIIGLVASISENNTINEWNPITWSSIQRYENHTDLVNDLDQIDNDTLVSGSDDGTIHIWKISTGETVQKIIVSERVNSVRVLLSGQQIACGCGHTTEPGFFPVFRFRFRFQTGTGTETGKPDFFRFQKLSK
jgi:WD40 repeat protein